MYFVGQYDYLLYSLLHRISAEEGRAQADFIVQEIKNSAETVDFLKSLTGKETPFGRFAAVHDEIFLNRPTEEGTVSAIVSAYEEILAGFGMRLQDYDHIYMSFDEWNSFGIYLAQAKHLPPVTVLAAYEGRLNEDIYHYLDAPDKFFFSNLQRRHRVLNADGPYVTDILVLREGFTSGDHKGKAMKGLNITGLLADLDEKTYRDLCEFFCFRPEDYTDGPYLLLVSDSYWFRNPRRRITREYVSMYKAFLDYFNKEDLPVLFKIHPRYALTDGMKSGFYHTQFLAGYVPVELLARPEAPPLAEVRSVGNGVHSSVCLRAGKWEIIPNDFVFDWPSYTRLDYIVRYCEKNGYKQIQYKGLSQVMIDTYLRVVHPECSVKFSEMADRRKLSLSLTKSIFVCKDVEKAEFLSNIRPRIDKGKPVFILNPEHDYCLLGSEADMTLREKLVSVRLRRYGLYGRGKLTGHEDLIWFFSANEKDRKQAGFFNYQVSLPFTGFRLRAGTYPRGNELLSFLPEDPVTKAYISLRARTGPVMIYGADALAYDFIAKYEKALNIGLIIADDEAMDRVDPRLSEMYEVIPFSEAEISWDDYVIICKPFIHNIDQIPPYAQTRDDLLRRGLQVGRHFTYWKLFDAIEKGLPVLLFCGYCELGGVKQILDLTSAADEYCMLFYHIGRETMRSAPGFDDFVASAKLCDILVHAPLLVNQGVMDVDVMKMIATGTRTIFLPQISFRGYAPYKIANFQRRNIGISLFGIIRYPFLYQIKFVNLMILRGRSNKEILARLKKPDLFSEEEIKKNLQNALRILQIMDAKADVPIYDFVRDHYQDALMFKDCIHANDVIFFEYARRFSDYLGKNWRPEIDAVEKRCKETGAYFQVASEEPILPCVAKALDLKFATEDRLYMEKVTEERIRMRTFDEWFNDYIDYYRSVVTVNRTLNREYRTQKVTIYRNETDEYRMERKE